MSSAERYVPKDSAARTRDSTPLDDPQGWPAARVWRDTSESSGADQRGDWLRVTSVDEVRPEAPSSFGFGLIGPTTEELGTELESALSLLKDASGYVQAAIAADPAEEPIAADYELSKLRALLPELFCRRGISDGFGALIIAIDAVLRNSVTEAWSARQLNALSGVIATMRAKPRMRFETATEAIERLEELGLDPTPKEVEALAELLDSHED